MVVKSSRPTASTVVTSTEMWLPAEKPIFISSCYTAKSGKHDHSTVCMRSEWICTGLAGSWAVWDRMGQDAGTQASTFSQPSPVALAYALCQCVRVAVHGHVHVACGTHTGYARMCMRARAYIPSCACMHMAWVRSLLALLLLRTPWLCFREHASRSGTLNQHHHGDTNELAPVSIENAVVSPIPVKGASTSKGYQYRYRYQYHHQHQNSQCRPLPHLWTARVPSVAHRPRVPHGTESGPIEAAASQVDSNAAGTRA